MISSLYSKKNGSNLRVRCNIFGEEAKKNLTWCEDNERMVKESVYELGHLQCVK